VPDYAFADTTVVSHLTKRSEHSDAYNAWRGDRWLAVNDQVLAELISANFTGSRKQRLEDLINACVKLPMSESTHVCYARVVAVRAELRTRQFEGRDAGDADVWVISSALEYGIPLFSHDRGQVQLARAAGLTVLTNIVELRAGNPQNWT